MVLLKIYGETNGEPSDNEENNVETSVNTAAIKKFAKKHWKILIPIAILLIIIVLLTKASIEDDGKYKEGDLSNVPYVISSMVMDKLVIVYDSTNNYTYAFQNNDGDYVSLDECLDEAIDTLKANGNKSLSVLGEDSSRQQRKNLLRKMIQAEIATQYPDLTLNEDLGLANKADAVSYTGSSNDYCVDMSSPNALPACSEEQLKQIISSSGMGSQGESNMSSVVSDLVSFQEQYGVNAVFFMAVCRAESGWGSGWDLIDPSTHNWLSVMGDENGGYIDRNGTSWNRYNSFSEATEAFFKLISKTGGYYFGSGRYTVQTIAPTYCDATWGEAVAGYVEGFYQSVGITPNLSSAPTASGGAGNSSVATGNSKKGTNSKTSSTSKGNPAVTGTTATGGNQEFLEKAAEVKKIVSEKGISYYINSTMDSSDPSASSQINCADYVSWSLLAAGYKPTTGNLLIYNATVLMHWLDDNGFEQVYAGQTLSVDEAGLLPGDIVIEGSQGGNEGSIGHTQIYAGKNESGEDIWYNCGGNTGSCEALPGEDNFSVPREPDHYILWAYRVPGGSATSSSPSNVTSTTGDEKIDTEIDQDKNVQGGIKIKRKDEDGNTTDLKYTSTKNFNALVSKNDPRALEYYTLVKTSGSSNSSSNNTKSSGDAAWGVTISYENWTAYRYHIGGSEVQYSNYGVDGFITQDGKDYIVVPGGECRYAGPGVQLESNADLFAEEGIDVNSLSVGSRIDCEIVDRVSQKALSNMVDYVAKDAQSHGVTLTDTQMQAVADVYYMNGPFASASTSFWSAYATYGDTDELGKNYSSFTYVPENTTWQDLAQLGDGTVARQASRWLMFRYGKYVSSQESYNPDDFTGTTKTSSNTNNSTTKDNTTKDNTTNKEDSKNTSSSSGSPVSSLDNFLFIGDSRYDFIEPQLAAVGNNVTAIGVGYSTPKNWIEPMKNGGGIVYKGYTTSSSEDIGTLPTSVSGVSVMLGVNGVGGATQISDMEELLNAIHDRYPDAPVMVNSVYHVGTAYTYANPDNMNKSIDEFNQAMQDFCNQNSWAYYIDISQDLDETSGYLKQEYANDGLHVGTTEGIALLVDNIKNGILNSNATTSQSSDNSNGRPGFQIVVANRKDTYITVTDTYEYSSSYIVEKANGIQTPTGQSTSTPADQVVKSSATTKYSSVNVDYQGALKNFTLYFDFLWAILTDSKNTSLISKWAELVSNNVGDESKVIITVYSEKNTSTSSSSQSKGTVTLTGESTDAISKVDIYNITETTNTKTVTLESKPCITSADTWLIKYENDADSYSEYKSKSKEMVTEKTETESTDNDEKNIIKILRKNKNLLETLTKEEYIVDNIIKDNEKVSFMVDVYDYILKIANGKSKENIKFKLESLLDTNLFDLSNTEDATSQKVLLYDALDISESDLELLYKAVEKICAPFGDDDDNTNRKKFVTSVILNRAMVSIFPNSVEKVLKQNYQFENFSPSDLDSDITIADSTKTAVDNVVVGGDCAQRSVYFAKPSTATSNDWDNKYKFTFNDGDKTDNSFNYYTTDEVESELAKYETTISGNVTKPSLTAQKIIKWANAQVGKSEFENKHDNKTMSSNNSSTQFIKSAYFEGGMEYISGDIPCPNEIKRKDDGTIDWSEIPETAVIVSNSGMAALYVGNGYVVEAGGSTIQKIPIDQSQSAKDPKGWGFAADDQDDARDKLVVAIGGGGVYPEGITEGTNFSGWGSASGDGVMMIYTANNHSYKVYCQGSGSYTNTPYWDGNVRSDGCGITSTSIILTGYGVDANPDTVIKDGLCPNGNNYEFYVKELEKYGIKSHIIYSGSEEEILNALKAGRPVIANVKGGIPIGNKGYGGHYVTLLGMDASGRIFLGDPGDTCNSGYYDQSKIFTGAIKGAIIIDS